jgi:hypothetical protein
MIEEKKLKLEFAPGCFDDFDGTQEELDELMEEITRMVASGEILNQSRSVDIDDLIEEDPELAQKLMKSFSNIETPRNLQ